MVQKRYWLRGGVILSIVYIPIFLWGIQEVFSVRVGYEGCWGVCLGIAVLPAAVIFQFLGINVGQLRDAIGVSNLSIIGGLVTFGVYFLLGSIIGWLYGKIKNRNRKSDETI